MTPDRVTRWLASSAGRAACCLEDARARGDLAIGLDEGHVGPALHRDAEDEYFGSEAGYAAGREVDHGHDQPADQVLRPVEGGELRARRAGAKLAEVDKELVGRVAGLGELLGAQHEADPDVGAEELVRTDHFGTGHGFRSHGRDRSGRAAGRTRPWPGPAEAERRPRPLA